MTFSDMEEAVKMLSERHVATIYAYNADDFVQVMINRMSMTIYSRTISTDTPYAPSIAGISVFTQHYLVPGVALFIDQFGQIMQVCRYEDDADGKEEKGNL